ncbi:hypothetical protein QJS10_CPB18g01683 [Acorus calamus]|uniref:Uncharacterized protein n=1 Tax=Acorus calamus TaxID=4465 RepID=A0AAV9CPJ2_ACOCL|nr:hypothetical protein QJS10_CPB18g01683 [Acorus calamus]
MGELINAYMSSTHKKELSNLCIPEDINTKSSSIQNQAKIVVEWMLGPHHLVAPNGSSSTLDTISTSRRRSDECEKREKEETIPSRGKNGGEGINACLIHLPHPPPPLVHPPLHLRSSRLLSTMYHEHHRSRWLPYLVCVNGECNNANPQAPICPVLPPSPPPATPPSSPPAVSPSTTPSQTCLPSGAAVCKFISYPLYNCSPPTTSPTTQATLTFNLLDGPGSLFAPSCDGMRHTQFEVVVAISTGFFNSGNLCGKHIQIKVASGREVVAKVVSQCNSASGCRGALSLNPPCSNNVIEGTRAVFRALGLPLRGSQTVQWTTV